MDEPGVIDWDEPNDGDTPEQMIAERQRQLLEEERQRKLNDVLWEKAVDGHYDRDGRIVIPFRVY